jgi:hypothetical protein
MKVVGIRHGNLHKGAFINPRELRGGGTSHREVITGSHAVTQHSNNQHLNLSLIGYPTSRQVKPSVYSFSSIKIFSYLQPKTVLEQPLLNDALPSGSASHLISTASARLVWKWYSTWRVKGPTTPQPGILHKKWCRRVWGYCWIKKTPTSVAVSLHLRKTRRNNRHYIYDPVWEGQPR